jgi:hypothetical protein
LFLGGGWRLGRWWRRWVERFRGEFKVVALMG